MGLMVASSFWRCQAALAASSIQRQSARILEQQYAGSAGHATAALAQMHVSWSNRLLSQIVQTLEMAGLQVHAMPALKTNLIPSIVIK